MKQEETLLVKDSPCFMFQWHLITHSAPNFTKEMKIMLVIMERSFAYVAFNLFESFLRTEKKVFSVKRNDDLSKKVFFMRNY